MSARANTSGADAILHASCVVFQTRGVLILGRSGSGKSSLALQLMALGFHLIADDKTRLRRTSAGIIATCPDSIAGLIEARGVGILSAQPAAYACVDLVVDLDETEKDRLPEPHQINLLECSLPCLHKIDAAHFPAAILQYIKGGKRIIP